MCPGVSWECRCNLLNERNCRPKDFHDIRVDWNDWEANVERCSKGELTYESDRLIAIEGLVNEYGKIRPEKYHLGVWLEDLLGQLMWRIFERSSHELECGMRGLSNLPSWSWAHWPGRKEFLYHKFPVPEEAQIGTRFVTLEDDEVTLTLKGSLMPCKISNVDVKGEYFAFQPQNPQSMMVTHWSTNSRLLWARNGQSDDLTGLVQIDEELDDTNLFCSIMLVGHRKPFDPLLSRNKTRFHGKSICLYSQ